MNYYYKTMATPVGELTLIASDKGLARILWEKENLDGAEFKRLSEDKKHPILLATERQLAEYFAGKRKTFSVKLDPTGTEFQTKVWNALKTIPFGETRSYAQIARQIGNAKAMRAVGAANGRNPISIVVPCHRVIGASGDLVGFGGGLKNKRLLLTLESKACGLPLDD
jgi:methylated-DNA-[protein]-cysteine S-methyltransferase